MKQAFQSSKQPVSGATPNGQRKVGIWNSYLDCTKFLKHQCVERKVAVLQEVIALTGPDQDLHTLTRIPAKKGLDWLADLHKNLGIDSANHLPGNLNPRQRRRIQEQLYPSLISSIPRHAHIEPWLVQSSSCDRKPCAWKGDYLSVSFFILFLPVLHTSIHCRFLDGFWDGRCVLSMLFCVYFVAVVDLYVYHYIIANLYLHILITFWPSWYITSVSICVYTYAFWFFLFKFTSILFLYSYLFESILYSYEWVVYYVLCLWLTTIL